MELIRLGKKPALRAGFGIRHLNSFSLTFCSKLWVHVGFSYTGLLTWEGTLMSVLDENGHSFRDRHG